MINGAHIHLMVNHFPVIGILFILLLFLYGLVRGSEEIKKLGIGAFVLLAIITIPVYLTGEGAEKVAKNLPGVTEAFIGRHEEIAGLSLVLIVALGIVCGAGLIFFRRSATLPKWFIALVLVLSFGAAAVVGLAANLGGQIRHTEIREVAASPAAPNP